MGKAKKMTYPYHDLVTMYPSMQPEEKAQVTESIRALGVLDPIVTYRDERGKVSLLDGRNRAEIWNELIDEGWEPPRPMEEWEFVGNQMQALAFVKAKNADRRHLDSSQRAIIAAEEDKFIKRYQKKLPAEEKLEAAEEDGKVRGDRAKRNAERHGTNRSYYFEAANLVGEAPAIAALVKEGVVNITDAKKLREAKVDTLRPDLLERLRESAAKPAPGKAEAKREVNTTVREVVAAVQDKADRKSDERKRALALFGQLVKALGDLGLYGQHAKALQKVRDDLAPEE